MEDFLRRLSVVSIADPGLFTRFGVHVCHFFLSFSFRRRLRTDLVWALLWRHSRSSLPCATVLLDVAGRSLLRRHHWLFRHD